MLEKKSDVRVDILNMAGIIENVVAEEDTLLNLLKSTYLQMNLW